MVGGLINIVSYGFDDLYLTGAAQVTFFKYAYRRHTNYSQESMVIDIGQTNFNEELEIPFPKVGDLFGNAYLQVTLPKISLLKTNIATNLNEDEAIFLQNPINLPSSYNTLQTIANDYSIVNNFMKTNMAGYRVAYKNLNITNQTVSDYVNSILDVLVFEPSISSSSTSSTVQLDYEYALQKALVYENTLLENTHHNLTLNYITSDISYILTHEVLDNIEKYTIDQVYQLVYNAKNISIKVKKYYFEKVKEMNAITVDYSSLYAKFAWIEKIGIGIAERIDITIGGDRIDRHYFNYIDIWHDLTGFNSQNCLYNKLIGNVIELTTFDRVEKPEYTITLPLDFWFCKKIGLYFPIVALQYSPISINIKFNSIDKCAYVESLPTIDNEGNVLDINQLSLRDIWDNMGYYMTANLLVDYVYLDDTERKRFAQSAHEYLIETTQTMSLTELTDNYQSELLEFNGPSKEIIWYAQKNAYLHGDETKKKLLFNYTTNIDGTGNPFFNSILALNGKQLFNNSITTYHNCVQTYSHHTRTPNDGVNVYSFCLFPEEHQPSGTCNFGIISNSIFTCTLDENMFKYNLSDIDPAIIKGSVEDIEENTTVNIIIISKKYEVLRIIGGMGGFAFKYMS